MDNGMDSWAVENATAVRSIATVATVAGTAIAAAVAVATAAVSWDKSRLFIALFFGNLKREGGSAQKQRTYKEAHHLICHRRL
jgi:hypothetical protein